MRRTFSITLLIGAAGCSGTTDVFAPATTAAATTTASSGGAAGSGGSSSTSATSGGGGAACVPNALAGVMQDTIDFGGLSRVYELQIPAAYTKNGVPAPLVFDLHGFTSNKDQQKSISGFSPLAEKEGFVVVRPDGYQTSWNGGDFCCGQAKQKGLDDVGLMRAIAAKVRMQLCIDPKRVYATGLSNGGALSHRIACEAADVFAMTVPVSYPLDFNPFDKCKPVRPISVMHFHGLNDLVVPYKGGASAPAAADSFKYWAKVDGCTGDPVSTLAKGASHCDQYKNCKAGAEVTLCSVNGGHLLYANVDSVPIAELAWQAMKQHPLP